MRVIRAALPDEAAAVTELHLRARSTYYPGGLPDTDRDWVTAWRSTIERPDAQVLCVVERDVIIGVASFRTAEGAPADTVKLLHVDNQRAQAFYRRLGWVPDPENPPAEGDHHLFLRYGISGTE